MAELDRARFGASVADLRRERGLTQKELAQRLYVTDKAVSKWERGLSLPDVALLDPLAGELGVTVPDLLAGERLGREKTYTPEEVEALMRQALGLTREQRTPPHRRKALLPLAVALVLALAETGLLLGRGYAPELLADRLVPVILAAVFGAYFALFAPERLPDCYDYVRLGAFHDGPVRINLPGLALNNGNWAAVKRAILGWCLAVLALYPLAYLGLTAIVPEPLPEAMSWPLPLLTCLALVGAVYRAGRK